MRMYHNIRILSQKHKVHVLSFIEREQEEEQVSNLEKLGVSVKTVLRRPSTGRDLILAKPREHFEYRSEPMSALVRATLEEQRIDVVQAEFVQMAQHVPTNWPAFRILTEHEIQFANAYEAFKLPASLPRKLRLFYDWMTQFNYEVRMCRRFHRVVCMTEEDLESLKRFVPARKLRAIPIGVDCKYFRPGEAVNPAPRPPRILFVGNYRHTPNQEAVYCFAESILPGIQSVLPETVFDVVGGNIHLMDSQRLRRSGRVNLIGQVEDVRPYYQQADVFVAPLYSGNGMRVKVLEACAMGKAIVASTLAVQGFHRMRPGSFRVADSPGQFVTATLKLLQDAHSRQEVGAQARQMIEEQYDWDVIEGKFLDLVETRDV
jgi:glycosyltransferase involved in cell wall biosynthesis